MTHHLPHTYLEDRHRQPDGTRIFYRAWRPTAALRATVVICPGFNSHGGQYIETAESLVAQGFQVYALDLRGRGRSDGPRFRVGDIAAYVEDVDAVVGIARARDPGLPVFLLGHSAGGVVSATYALDHGEKLAGLICESFAFRVPAPKVALAVIKGIARIFPGLPAVKLKNRDFTRDPERLDRLNADMMILNETQPAITVAAMVRANERLERDFVRFTLPVLILHGTADRATLPAGSEFFARNAGASDTTLKLYDGHYHDLLADLGREIVLQDIFTWIDSRLPR
ncbi:alpha/beta hydrolase [Marinibacterium profundimaris]|uniref:Serine aminopeptidase S33 domain-containing protein n=1 Tax=Marinibacterium profundimaris TaxID=1679460 RepID=A0A225NL88_9RHOB|nr:alpha/beta hydrolase [Marinibacterium profundimaris]OWU73238.1 hypothetical protein ATO3_11055 [Marinibacterium profundimaris]